ncbi:hypothetical protein Ahy_A01g004587 isoform A [Arachis hypogaea]|uniref:Uncharacterized protein n=1 Tax=Arachis hypogaea TaxID=3818 RepID=A0A445EWH0_ARAHY|nr:hypothetical protein Ahy_A01g004587 isoform A [Arachis hypogaea]
MSLEAMRFGWDRDLGVLACEQGLRTFVLGALELGAALGFGAVDLGAVDFHGVGSIKVRLEAVGSGLGAVDSGLRIVDFSSTGISKRTRPQEARVNCRTLNSTRQNPTAEPVAPKRQDPAAEPTASSSRTSGIQDQEPGPNDRTNGTQYRLRDDEDVRLLWSWHNRWTNVHLLELFVFLIELGGRGSSADTGNDSPLSRAVRWNIRRAMIDLNMPPEGSQEGSNVEVGNTDMMEENVETHEGSAIRDPMMDQYEVNPDDGDNADDEPTKISDDEVHSTLSLNHSPPGHRRTQRQPTAEFVTCYSPRRLLCLVPAPSVFARLCLLRLCRPGRLGSAVPRLSLPPPRASSASASSVAIVLAPLQALLCSSSKLCLRRSSSLSRRRLALQRCSTATTPSWKIALTPFLAFCFC